jgi:3-deoxy-D-manno-octulosonic-acid transferase
MTRLLVLLLYGLLTDFLQPFVRRKMLRRGQQEPGYLEALDERFGHYSATMPSAEKAGNGGWLWLHAVSLGETRAAAVLLAELRQQAPGLRLLLTHGTATGRAAGQALLREGDFQIWLPWDAPGPVKQFFEHFQPRVGILLETEVWPSVVAAAQARAMPLLLVNARLSEKSLAKAQRFGWLARPAYQALTAVYAQTPADAQRLTLLGANVQGVFGNVKFDAQPRPALLAQGTQWRSADAAAKPVVLFTSSREGEEALLLQHLATLPAPQRDAVQWLIVPRHPQRFDAVAALVQAQGFSLSCRSAWPEAGPAAVDTAQVWLGDSLGEMPMYYALSDVALLGGSFLPLGGQNLIEAAACGCPIVMGPHTFNFAEAAENSAAAGAAFTVADLPAAITQVVHLLQNKALLTQAQIAAQAFVVQHQGAAKKTAAVLARWL